MKHRKLGPRHMFIPDTQCKPGVPLEHLRWAGRYCGDKLINKALHAGDHYDMHALSMYDRGKLAGEGARYEDDIEWGNRGLDEFARGCREGAGRRFRSWQLDQHVFLGNHENRINVAINEDPRLEGKLNINDLGFKERGWRVHPFLRPVEIDGVTYMHYCPLNAQGRVTASKYGCPSALSQARRMMRSTVCGHKQGLDTAVVHTPGRTVRGVIAGSFYQHQEEYLTAAGETYWRGVLVFNDVQKETGEFDIMELSLDYLRRKYG